jgi:hypothetical protein
MYRITSPPPKTRDTKALSKLAEVFDSDLARAYPSLRQYVGATGFAVLEALLSEYKSEPHLRLENLSQMLATHSQFQKAPELAEIAQLDWQLTPQNYIFDDFKQAQGGVVFLRMLQNTASIYAALKCSEMPPRPHALDAPQTVIVWTYKHQRRFRISSEAEFEAYEIYLARGKMAEQMALFEPYMPSWAEAGLLTA